MTDPVRPSTLDEINRQLVVRMFEVMNFSSPSSWTDPTRVIYSPADDLEYALELWMGKDSKSRPERMAMPFGYVTRYTGQAVEDTYNFARRPWSEWLSSHAHDNPRSESMVKVVPTTLQYLFKIYDDRVAKIESLLDVLIQKTIREKSRAYLYDSAVLGMEARYRIELGNPQYDRSATLKERVSGRGRVYSIVLPLQIYCLLGEGVPAKRIERIEQDFRVYRPETPLDSLGRPLPGQSDKIDSILIDSSTQIGEL